MGFAAISGYAFALLATTVERKARIVPDVPLGLDGVSLNPLVAAAAAVVITVVAGVVVGLGLARSGAKSGAVAATVITLALLFMVHEVGGAYADLTGGRNGISFSVGRGLDSRLWVYLALIAVMVLARLFKSSRVGRMAQAAREDDLAARAMGFNPVRGQMVALVLSVAVVSVAASLRVFQLGTVAPSTFFFNYTLLTPGDAGSSGGATASPARCWGWPSSPSSTRPPAISPTSRSTAARWTSSTSCCGPGSPTSCWAGRCWGS